jgi:hypothetical protein
MAHNAFAEERTVMANSPPAVDRISFTDAAIRAIESPFRRLGWYLRTCGLAEWVAAAVVLFGALASFVWFATLYVAAL